MNQSRELIEKYAGKRRELSEQMWLVDLVLNRKAIISDYGEIQTESFSLYREIQEHYESWEFWKDVQEFSLQELYPERYEAQKHMLLDEFLPKLNEKDILFDMACANGEWTEIVGEKVSRIDGYEYSGAMVELAKERAQKKRITNIKYVQADATDFKTGYRYDAGMCLGLFTCLADESAQKAIVNVSDMIKAGGYLAAKDTLNMAGEDCIYHFNYNTGYQAVYRSVDVYYRLFADAGFELVYETNLDGTKLTVDTEDISFISRGTVWVKR